MRCQVTAHERWFAFSTRGCRAAASAACGLAAACSRRCRACSAMYAPAAQYFTHDVRSTWHAVCVCCHGTAQYLFKDSHDLQRSLQSDAQHCSERKLSDEEVLHLWSGQK